MFEVEKCLDNLHLVKKDTNITGIPFKNAMYFSIKQAVGVKMRQQKE